MLKRIIRKHRGVHVYEHGFGAKSREQEYLLISDIHWDNPKCDWKLLRKHLDEAKERDAKVIVNGDFFCLMQGRGDKRGSKSDVRPEHNNDKYYDSIIETALEWFKPYVNTLVQINFGNHETSIIKYAETDMLQRFVDMFNLTYKPDFPLNLGGYGGWCVFKFELDTKKGVRSSLKMHYFHGAGGGGPVTKNMIQHQRNDAMIEGADIVWLGHVHELFHQVTSKHYLSGMFDPKIKQIHHLQTATYKEEFDDRHHGWHVQRGAPPKPLGGYWMKLKKVGSDKHTEVEFRQTSFQ